MQMPTKDHKPQPLLPVRLSRPLQKIPVSIHSKLLTNALNRIFKQEIIQGELDFLLGKIICIEIDDAGIKYRLTLKNNALAVADKNQAANLILQGTVYNYLLLASRREDTDALFFSRRLRMQGDTELGLYVKNFLDGMDMDSHKIPAYFESLLQKSLPLYERLFAK